MKTHIKNLMPLLLLSGLPAVARAQDAYSTNADGSIYTYDTNDDGSANIVAYAGPPWVVTIPTNINGLSVTSIGEYAFDETPLTGLTIPGSLTSIGADAFAYTSLTNVTIPYSVTSIGEAPFESCGSLTAIMVDTNNPSYSSLNGVLFDKSQTTLIEFPGGLGGSYTISNSVISIGDAAFGGCRGLTSMTIPNSVTSIGEGAFAVCSGLRSVTIGDNVTSIGNRAFNVCSGLTSVTIPNRVTSIGDNVFYRCTNLTGVYFQGNSPTPNNDSSVFSSDPATVYYLPGTTGWGSTFDGLPTALWFLPYPLILNNSSNFGVQPGGFGFTISWATNASVMVEAATNLANPVWLPVSTNALTSGTNYFSDPQWTNYPGRFYRVTSTPTFPGFTVGGTVTGLSSWDSITLQDNGGDDLTLSTNGTFTFPTALPNGKTYSVALYTTSGEVVCTITNGSGTISGANVTNVAVSCYDGCPPLTGDRDLDMYNAAVADGTANGGVPGVMYTENGGPVRVTAAGRDALCSDNVCEIYSGWAVFTHVVGTYSCSSTSFTNGTPVIQFGGLLECGFGPYGY